MYRPLVFVIFIVVISVADNSMEKCEKILHVGIYSCCPELPKSLKPLKITFEDDLKECFEIPVSAPCDQAVCVAKKKGYYAADGSFDREAYAKILQNEFNFDLDLLLALKENCLEADVSKYGPSNMCDFLKIRNCLHIQFLLSCPEWNDNAECSGMKDLVEECTKDT